MGAWKRSTVFALFITRTAAAVPAAVPRAPREEVKDNPTCSTAAAPAVPPIKTNGRTDGQASDHWKPQHWACTENETFYRSVHKLDSFALDNSIPIERADIF